MSVANEINGVYPYKHAWYSDEHSKNDGVVHVYQDHDNPKDEVYTTFVQDAEEITKPLRERYPYADAKYVGCVKLFIRTEFV